MGALLKLIMEARLSGCGRLFYFTREKLKHFLYRTFMSFFDILTRENTSAFCSAILPSK
jgi:hypothetical protein